MRENMFTEKDWKLFRSKIGEWQENYMDKLNKSYIEWLRGDGNPSEKFRELEKRIRADKKKTGVRAEISRSELIYNILPLLHEGAISMDDLEEFSDELKARVRYITKGTL